MSKQFILGAEIVAGCIGREILDIKNPELSAR